MFRYFVRRVLVMIPTLLVISALVFIIIQLPEGDYLTSHIAELEAQGVARLRDAGLRADYLAIRRREDLKRPLPDDHALVILAAVFLGRARLIDNVTVALPV